MAERANQGMVAMANRGFAPVNGLGERGGS